jgi:hypothetical protein
MRSDVRRAALMAALKTTRSVAETRAALKSAVLRSGVALGLSGTLLGGCYEMHGVPPRVVPPPPDAAALPDVVVVADAPVRPDSPPIDLPCDELLPSLEITAPEGGWGAQFTSEVARLDPTVGACCHELELAARAGTPVVEPFTPLAFACCDVVVFQQNLEPYSELGCTPWGPPCPPEMLLA